jgi:hypothetical protein
MPGKNIYALEGSGGITTGRYIIAVTGSRRSDSSGQRECRQLHQITLAGEISTGLVCRARFMVPDLLGADLLGNGRGKGLFFFLSRAS